jgi:hypothetical protein
MMEAARTSEKLVNLYQITQLYNPEDSHLHGVSRSLVLLPAWSHGLVRAKVFQALINKIAVLLGWKISPNYICV